MGRKRVASGFPTGFTPQHTAGPRVRCVLPKGPSILTLSCRIRPRTPAMHDRSHRWRKPDRATRPSHAPFRPATLVPVLQAARTEHACGGHDAAPVQSDLLASNGPPLADFAG